MSWISLSPLLSFTHSNTLRSVQAASIRLCDHSARSERRVRDVERENGGETDVGRARGVLARSVAFENRRRSAAPSERRQRRRFCDSFDEQPSGFVLWLFLLLSSRARRIVALQWRRSKEHLTRCRFESSCHARHGACFRYSSAVAHVTHSLASTDSALPSPFERHKGAKVCRPQVL